MMWAEFEELAGYQVTMETYEKIIEPMYMATNMSKQDFIKVLNRKALEYKPEHKPFIKKMLVRDRSGYRKTPNGCWYHIEYVDLVSVDIRTGKYVVAPLDEKHLEEIYKSGHSLDISTDYDMDYTDCIDSKTKKPVTLHWDW